MGEVIQGPWRRRDTRGITFVLADEIARMTRALEELRELHRRNERTASAGLPALVESRPE